MSPFAFWICILFLLATDGLATNPSLSQIYSERTATSESPKTQSTHPNHHLPAPDPISSKDNDAAAPDKKKKKPEKVTVKFCNHENFHQGHGICMNHVTVEGKCKTYSWPAPFTAMSFRGDLKCMLYARPRCNSLGRMVFLEEPTINIGAAINDKVWSFRCVKRFAPDAPRAAAYMCTRPDFRGRCQDELPFVGECRDLQPAWRDKLNSFAPEKGHRCTLFQHPRCNVETAGLFVALEAPGVVDLGNLNSKVSSYKCIEHSQPEKVARRLRARTAAVGGADASVWDQLATTGAARNTPLKMVHRDGMDPDFNVDA
ncbi:hypothetical protein IWX90DRAFT_261194 [Phyllosticta citrichinensis]|uniref:Uncharacterized protein n=1 Tax=Phyllosticta citrichinensis TaxID=1130410 RepID=A0ABR1XS24_9PEZI